MTQINLLCLSDTEWHGWNIDISTRSSFPMLQR